MSIAHIRVILAVLVFTHILFSASAIKHRFIGIDEGLGNLLYINEYDSTTNWRVAIGQDAPRDMQLVGNNRILIGHTKGYKEYDITTGAVKRDVASYNNVTSVRRLPGGKTLIIGVDLDGSKGVVMLTLDSLNVKIKKTVYPGNYVRLVRQTATGTFLFACNDTVKEADTNGVFIWKAYITTTPATEKHMWKAVRIDNGNILLSAGYGACMVEMNSTGAIVRKFGAAPQAAGINPSFYAMFQLLPNGNCVVANWQGHGAGNGNKGIELLEYNAAGAIVWQWNNAALVSSMQGVVVLDSLDASLLYDDRNGKMVPLVQGTATCETFHISPAPALLEQYRTAGLAGNRCLSLDGRIIASGSLFSLPRQGCGITLITTHEGVRRVVSVAGKND